jgi:hypothetical protein
MNNMKQLTHKLWPWGTPLLSQNLLNYDGPHVAVIVIITSDSYTYVPHNLKGLLSFEQDSITGVFQYYNNLFKYHQSKRAEVLHNLSLQTTVSNLKP